MSSDVTIDIVEGVLRRDRAVVILSLLSVISLAWLYLLAGAGMGMYPHEMSQIVPDPAALARQLEGAARHSHVSGASSGPAGWTSSYALLVFGMWWLMMVAMMLPSASPMVLTYAAVTRAALVRSDGAFSPAGSNRLARSTTAFGAGYLVMWGSFSLVAVVAQWALERAGLLSAMMMSESRSFSAGLLLAAGAWQLTPLKSACLRHCRSPMSFISRRWRPGAGGAFGMGLEHGMSCLGCCWVLMALMFYGGAMNLAWIVGLALIVLAEKLLPGGLVFARVSGSLLILAGCWLGFTAH